MVSVEPLISPHQPFDLVHHVVDRRGQHIELIVPRTGGHALFQVALSDGPSGRLQITQPAQRAQAERDAAAQTREQDRKAAPDRRRSDDGPDLSCLGNVSPYNQHFARGQPPGDQPRGRWECIGGRDLDRGTVWTKAGRRLGQVAGDPAARRSEQGDNVGLVAAKHQLFGDTGAQTIPRRCGQGVCFHAENAVGSPAEIEGRLRIDQAQKRNETDHREVDQPVEGRQPEGRGAPEGAKRH